MHAVVIGAGFVGLSTAFRLLEAGCRVTLLDPAGPAGGASFGNAGTFANYACIPINHPSIFRDWPSLLTSADSPLALRAGYLPKALPWLGRFLLASTARRSTASSEALAQLLNRAAAPYETLIAATGLEPQVSRRECLYVYSSERGFQRQRPSLDLRERLGVRFDVLDAAGIQALEPGLAPIFQHGVLFHGSWFLRNPAEFLRLLHARLVSMGLTSLPQTVERIHSRGSGLAVRTGTGDTLSCDRVVLAAGAHSKRLAAQCGDRVPMDTERGYHVRFADAGNRLGRPVGWAERGFYLTPMANGLRAAGTVEIGGFHRRHRARLTGLLRRAANEAVPGLGEGCDDWLGFRPTLPDGLPVIGPSRNSPGVVHAFGHQHLGLTLGALTGALVADRLTGKEPAFDLTAFSPGRFHHRRAAGIPVANT